MHKQTQLSLFDENTLEDTLGKDSLKDNQPSEHREADIVSLKEAVLGQINAIESWNGTPQGDLRKALKQYLQALVQRRYFTHIDLYFAEFIAGQKKYENAQQYLGYSLLLLLVSRAYGFGHTALPFAFLNTPQHWFIENDDRDRINVIADLLMMAFGEEIIVTEQGDNIALSAVDLRGLWQSILMMVSVPLVKTAHGLYLDRNFQQETEIIHFFKNVKESTLSHEEAVFVQKRLDHYFKIDEEINWQKFAAANALLNNVSVISGGPGTGKTTTVFKILQTLVDLHHYRDGVDGSKPFTILLAAPTGKAAARLSESILGQIRHLSTEIETEAESVQMMVRKQLELIPYKGQTLHRLLMIHPFTRKPKFNHFNPLNFDVLVVDEASMIDQQMLVQLINALPKSGRVIFLGDKDQLASVEAGAIMHELCVQENYSQTHFQHLQQLLSEPLNQSLLVHPDEPAFNYLSFLKKSYRFKSDSALGDLAKLVNDDGERRESTVQYDEMMRLLSETNSELESSESSKQPQDHVTSSLRLQSLPIEQSSLAKIIHSEFKDYLKILPRNAGIEFAEKAFSVFNKLGILSARRTGEYGALALNDLIRKTLFPRDAHREFFHGLPIMITHNSVENNLFNGDIGLILYNETGTLSAYFEGVDSARVFSIHSLPKFEPAFAMTIHKSQGSEFERILLFLGTESSAFLTKELFYTGITRAKKSVQIFASEGALKAALAGRVDRYSFIHTRLREESLGI